ncbi:dihydrofolate reductase [Nocardia sp. NPDC058499]|uniref:dihydrofolate reductase n=1 Tax=Nocardia sp. NPDC058499 TaxID=3346530 RepID=UPI00365E7362
MTLVAAVARNGVIGRDGDLAWRDREDLQRVKRLTMGKTLIMGRRTFESVGRPLPGRTTIVVTRRNAWSRDGVTAAGSIDEAIAAAGGEEIVCFGGGEIYTQLIDEADRLEITEIETSLDGDVYFPPIDRNRWQETERIQRDGYSWVSYLRRS